MASLNNNSKKRDSKIMLLRPIVLVVLFSVVLVLGTTGFGWTGSSSTSATRQQHQIVYAQNIEDCFDGIDNDGDIATDIEDSDCSETSSSNTAPAPNGLQSSGNIDSAASIQAAQANICNPSSATLRIMAKGPEVTNLQKILIQLGYSVGPKGADGDFGKATQTAVIKFQQDNKLQIIDGEVGPETWNALCSLVSSLTTQTTQTTPIAPSKPVPPTAPLVGPPSSTGYIKCTPPGKDPTSLQAFINNPEASTLDFLPKNKCLEYRNLKWNYYDYYGGEGRKLVDKDGKPVTDKYGNTKEPRGPNEDITAEMIGALKRVNLERRATVEEGGVPAGTAVLCVKCAREDPHIIIENLGKSQKRTISPELWTWIQNQLVPVPGTGKQLNKYAAESFQKMKENASRQGINIEILSGDGAAFRSKTAADTGCLRAGNNFAVACFPNSHNLGLAVDLKMSCKNQKYEEATTLGTYGMQNVVDMRESCNHKWLFLHAAEFGFYPFTHEPWHWEYDPPNFASTFFAGAPK